MAISFNQGGGNVFNFNNNNSQVSIDNKKKLLNAGAQDINQGMAMNPKPGDSVVFNQGNNNNASFQGFNDGMANIGLQMTNQAMVMNSPQKPHYVINCPTPPPITDPPITQPPITQPPITQPPITQPPVTPPPITQPPITQQPPTPKPPDVCIVPCLDPHTGEFHYYLPVDNSTKFGFMPNDQSIIDNKSTHYVDPREGYYFFQEDYNYDTKSVPTNKRLTYEQYQDKLKNYQDGDNDITWSPN